MPSTPYIVSGTIKNSSSTNIQGAVVQAKNIRTDEYLPSGAVFVSNSSGEYLIDLGNWTANGYQNGDVYRVYVYKPQEFATFEGVINTDVGSQDKNFTTTAVTYTTPHEVASFIGSSKTFHITSTPNIVDVCKLIVSTEDYI